MSYVLATHTNRVEFYYYDISVPSFFVLKPYLDLQFIPVWRDKSSAKRAALHLSLKTWRYVRV